MVTKVSWDLLKVIYYFCQHIRLIISHKNYFLYPFPGVYTPGQGVGQPSTKVRGHNLMVPDRPACVTLLSLVRDAAARLPNGEGTRAEICELMKESQYLASGAEASLHSVVSGALDRLHYEADPCVKYDSARKVWIYLHRHRSESEFGKSICLFVFLISEVKNFF
jgi:nuclear factor related to kappa-B-binding protein